jgi:TonB family protein
MSAPLERELLATIPGGRLLERLLALLLSPDRRDEFVGDLVEQARQEQGGRPPLRIGLWLWGQTLHSAPALVTLRLRRLGRRSLLALRPSARAPHGWAALGSDRAAARSWPVPMAVSVTLHALALVTLVSWTLGVVEEVGPPRPPWVPVVIGRATLPLGESPVPTVGPHDSEPDAPPAGRPQRRSRPAPRVQPAPVNTEGATFLADDLGSYDHIPADVVKIHLPPLVAEKRCISCPKPRLPPAYARLGAEQQILVKTCVAATGDVTSVDVLRGLGAGADAGVVDTVRSWRFSPHSVGDHPVPFCYPTRFIFAMN